MKRNLLHLSFNKSEKYCLKRIKVCFIDGYYKQLEYNLEISFIIINISNV